MAELYLPRTLEEFLEYCHRYDPRVYKDSGCVKFQDEQRFNFSCRTVKKSEVIWSIQKALASNFSNNLRDFISHLVPYPTYKEYSLTWSSTEGARWIVGLRQETQYDRIGEFIQSYEFSVRGVTLGEADRKLTEKYAVYLQKRDKAINFFLGQPSTIDVFVKVCQEHGLDIQKSDCRITVEHNDVRDITFRSYKISGKLSEFKVKLEVSLAYCKSIWTISKIYPVEVEACAKTLLETIQKYQDNYDKLRGNPELWQQAIDSKRLKDEEKARQWDAQEGQALFEYLVSEFGEDIFPDHD